MPYVIVSTVAIFANLFKKTCLVVGDQESDPELMRFLGARLVKNYPVCGSPPVYVAQTTPRGLFEQLEKRGFCLLTSDTVEDHFVWIFARPRHPEDDKQELQRGGPNDKAIQVGGAQENADEQKDMADVKDMTPVASSTPRSSET